MNSKKHPKVTVRDITKHYGSQEKMCAALKRPGELLTRQAISQWEEVPVKWVLRIEKQTGFSRHQVRPDVYGDRPSDIGFKELPKRKKAA